MKLPGLMVVVCGGARKPTKEMLEAARKRDGSREQQQARSILKNSIQFSKVVFVLTRD